MQTVLGKALLAAGAVSVVAFVVTGQLMGLHDPPVSVMAWDDRLLFRSRHMYILLAGLVSLGIGVNFTLPSARGRRWLATTGVALVLASQLLLLLAFFLEAMALNYEGMTSSLGLYAVFGGVLMYVLACLRRHPEGQGA